MPALNENFKSNWRSGYFHVSDPQSCGLWLIMLKDNIQDESPEFGMISLLLNPQRGTCIGTYVYADQEDDLSCQLEWSYKEPTCNWVSNYRNESIEYKEHDTQVLGVTLEYPGEKPMVFLGIQRS